MKFKPIASYKPGCKECLKIASQKGQPFRKTEIGDRNSWYGNGAYNEEINHLISHPQLNPTFFGVLVNSFSYLVYEYYNNGNGNLVSVEPVEEECGSCLGEGDQECWSCNGEGEDWEGDECDECNGSGMVDCEPCYGMGEQDGGYEVTGIDSHRYEEYIQPIYDLTNRSSAGRGIRDAMYRLEAALEKGVLNDGHNRERNPLYSPQKDKLYTDLGDAIGFYIINEPNSLTGGNNFLNYMAEEFSAESFDAEDKRTLKKDSCCCGATKSVPCECMYLGNQCSARKPMCQCYKLLSVQTDGKKAEESFEANCGNKRDAEDFQHQKQSKRKLQKERESGNLTDRILSILETVDDETLVEVAYYFGIEFEGDDDMDFLYGKVEEAVKNSPTNYLNRLDDILYDSMNAENFDADWFTVKCVECEKPGYSDEMNRYNGMYLCARCANPHLDFSRYDYEAETFYEVMGIKPMAKGGKRWVIENELGIPIGDFDSITAGKKAAIEDYAKKSKKTEGMMFWPPAFFGKGSHRKSNKGYTVHRNAAEGILVPTSSKSILAIALIAGFLYGRRQ
tara:strand:- start:28368 stop:30056 length:1689 start_codon:yes stop_codon:yes gene_type:complete